MASLAEIRKQSIINWQRITSTAIHFKLGADPISFGSSIWFAQHDLDSGGMVEFQTDSDFVSSSIPYPQAFIHWKGFSQLVFCKSEPHSIVVIDIGRCCGIVFDTTTREYGEMFPIPSGCTDTQSYVVIGDFLHIFHATMDCKYTICSLTDGSSKTLHGDYCDKMG